MDIKPFYELRTRLYLSAAAGCSVISEDFRLKRAVENFKPMSEANKVFGKLYLMCDKLFSAENPASQIADCIALADALAVTQGNFVDPAETEPAEHNFSETVSLETPYSFIDHAVNEVKNGKMSIDFSDRKVLEDPRVLAAFISKSGVNNENIISIGDILCSHYGRDIIPLLKKSIDLSNPKETGNQVEYICRIAGAEENRWYTELAVNEGNPQNVRIQAVKAMALSSENADILMQMYHTQKGKVKNEVISSLAVINPPEAEPVWTKMTESVEKFKKVNVEYIALSENKICSDFAKKKLLNTLEKLQTEEAEKDIFSSIWVYNDIELLANKPDIEDFALWFSDYCRKNPEKLSKIRVKSSLNKFADILAVNTKNHPDNPAYTELVHNLCQKDIETFFRAEFLMNLIKNPDSAFDELENISIQNRIDISNLLGYVGYTKNFQTYYINLFTNIHKYSRESVHIFKSIPEKMLEFLADTSFMNNRNCPEAKKEELCGNISSIFSVLLEHCPCSQQDVERVKKYASEFIFATVHEFPNVFSLSVLSRTGIKESSEKYRGIACSYLKDCLKDKRNKSFTFILSYIERFPMSCEDKISELKEMRKIYETHSLQNRDLHALDEYIFRYLTVDYLKKRKNGESVSSLLTDMKENALSCSEKLTKLKNTRESYDISLNCSNNPTADKSDIEHLDELILIYSEDK